MGSARVQVYRAWWTDKGPNPEEWTQNIRDLVGVVNVEHNRTRPPAVQSNIVIGSGEPGGDLLGVAAGLVLPVLPTMLPGCLLPRLTGSTYHPCFCIEQRSFEVARVRRNVRY